MVGQALLVVAVALALLIVICHLWTEVFEGCIEGCWLEFFNWGLGLLGLALLVLTLVYIFVHTATR